LLLSVRHGAYVTLKHPVLDQLRHGGTLDSINQAIYRILLLGCAIAVLELAWQIGQAGLRAYRSRAAATR
jgi:hypothetical protein